MPILDQFSSSDVFAEEDNAVKSAQPNPAPQDTEEYATPDYTYSDHFEDDALYTDTETASIPQEVNSIQITISDK